MIKILWNNLYQYSYSKELLTNNSDYFNSMLNDIYLDNNESIINIQLPNYINIDQSIINIFTIILNNLTNLKLINNELNLNYHMLLSITYILSYIQIHNITNLITYLNKLEYLPISLEIDSPNNIIYKWLIYYHLEDYVYCKEILSNYDYHTIKIIIGNILNYNYDNPNYYDIMDILYNTILDIAPILVTDIEISNLFCIDIEIANLYLDTLSTTNKEYQNLLDINIESNLIVNNINEVEKLNKFHTLTNNIFINIPWDLDILISGNLLLLLFLEKVNVETYSLDFYINNKPDKIKLLIEYIYNSIGNENYTIILDNMISIFSSTINFHINIHYTNYRTPLELLYNFHFDYQEIFLVSNNLYCTTNFIKTIKSNITNIKSSITLFDLYYTLSIPLSIYNFSLNYIKTNYKLDRERLNKNYLENINNIIENKYGYFLPLPNYTIDKNKYEIMRVYGANKVYYNNEFTNLLDIIIEKNNTNGVILEYTDSYTQCNMKIDKYNILNHNYKIEKFALENMKLLTINENITNLKSTKYQLEIELNINNHKHIELYTKIDNLRLELVNILKTNLDKKIKTIIPSKELLVLNLNNSTKIYNYHRKMISITELIEIKNNNKKLLINGLFEIEYMTLILDTIYIKKYLKELYLLDDINT